MLWVKKNMKQKMRCWPCTHVSSCTGTCRHQWFPLECIKVLVWMCAVVRHHSCLFISVNIKIWADPVESRKYREVTRMIWNKRAYKTICTQRQNSQNVWPPLSCTCFITFFWRGSRCLLLFCLVRRKMQSSFVTISRGVALNLMIPGPSSPDIQASQNIREPTNALGIETSVIKKILRKMLRASGSTWTM